MASRSGTYLDARSRVTVDVSKIASLRAQGRSWAEITDEIGVSKGTAQRNRLNSKTTLSHNRFDGALDWSRVQSARIACRRTDSHPSSPMVNCLPDSQHSEKSYGPANAFR